MQSFENARGQGIDSRRTDQIAGRQIPERDGQRDQTRGQDRRPTLGHRHTYEAADRVQPIERGCIERVVRAQVRNACQTINVASGQARKVSAIHGAKIVSS